MRVKVISILVCLSLLLSFTPLLVLPPTSVQASPFQVLNLTYTATSFEEGNIRTIPVEPGDEILQFIGPNIILDTNPHCHLDMVDRSIGSVSGDLSGNATIEWQTLYATDSLLSPAGKGYMVGTATLNIGSDSMVGCVAVDVDFSPPSAGVITIDGDARLLFHTCTGPNFSGQVMMGTGHASGTYVEGVGITSQSATLTLRRYAASDPEPFTFSGTDSSGSSGFEHTLGLSSGNAPTDEFVQFLPPLHTTSIVKGTGAYYLGAVITGSFNGAISGQVQRAGNSVGLDSGYGLGMGMLQLTNAVGSMKLILLLDVVAGGWGSADTDGYILALKGDSTGQYGDADRYARFSMVETDLALTGTGNLYTLSAPQTLTATGTGYATLAPDSGSIENLVAVSESSMPEEGKPDVDFPHGFFEFDITGLTPDIYEEVDVTITLPPDPPVPDGTQYWKYGPTPSDPSPHWYMVPVLGISGNTITIRLVDGGLGDDDLTADGTIIDQGGPGWPFPPAGGGSGVPVFPSIYIGIGAALGAGVLAYLLRRKMVAG